MTKVTYAVFVRGPVPHDLNERISQAHAKAVLASKARLVKTDVPSEEQACTDVGDQVNNRKCQKQVRSGAKDC